MRISKPKIGAVPKAFDTNNNEISYGMKVKNLDQGNTFMVDTSMMNVLIGIFNEHRDTYHDHLEVVA